MVDFPPLASFISYSLLFLLFVTFFYALYIRFVSDETLFDRTIFLPSNPRKLTYQIEPPLQNGIPNQLPSIFAESEIYVSFVVPAYNEEKRLPAMLDATLRYLSFRQSEEPSFTYEILIVDDGSKDGTANLALEFSKQFATIRLLRQPVNMGKGAAIQAGCLHARGKYMLMIDADGATKVECFNLLEERMKILQRTNVEAIVVGSRASEEAQRTKLRAFLGKGFHFLILLSGVKGIQDTQCGFKLFSREAARWLFTNQHVQRWCFDPELLVIANRLHMIVSEVPVEWKEIEGSKMKISSMIKMGIDLIQIAVFYRVRFWTIKTIKN